MGIPAANIPPQPGPQPGAEGARWQVRKRDGTVMQFPSLSLFQKWVADGVIALDDSISRNGHQWRPITSIPELVGLFERVAQARWGRPNEAAEAPPLPDPEDSGAPPPLPDLSDAPEWQPPPSSADELLGNVGLEPPSLDEALFEEEPEEEPGPDEAAPETLPAELAEPEDEAPPSSPSPPEANTELPTFDDEGAVVGAVPYEPDRDDAWIPSLDDLQGFPDESGSGEGPENLETLQDFRVPSQPASEGLSLEEEMALAGQTMEIRAPEARFELGRAIERDLAATAPATQPDPFATMAPEPAPEPGPTPAPLDEQLQPVPAFTAGRSPAPETPATSRGGRYAAIGVALALLAGGGFYAWTQLQPVPPTWPDDMAVLRALQSTPVAVATTPAPQPEPVVTPPPAPEKTEVLSAVAPRTEIAEAARSVRRGLADAPPVRRAPPDRKPVKKPVARDRKPGPKPEKVAPASAPGNDYDALMVAARKAQKAGRQRDAITYLERASQLNPRSVEPIAKLGWAYLSLGNATQAILKFQEAKQKNPGYRDTYIGLAKAMERAGRTADAIAVYRQYLRMCPNCRKAEGVRASLMRLGAEP